MLKDIFFSGLNFQNKQSLHERNIFHGVGDGCDSLDRVLMSAEHGGTSAERDGADDGCLNQNNEDEPRRRDEGCAA